MRRILVAGLLVVSAGASAQAYYTDQYNNVVGSGQTVGNTTYYTDQRNNVIGSSESRGNTTYYTDQRNNVVGSGTSPNPQQNQYQFPSAPAPIYNQNLRR